MAEGLWTKLFTIAALTNAGTCSVVNMWTARSETSLTSTANFSGW